MAPDSSGATSLEWRVLAYGGVAKVIGLRQLLLWPGLSAWIKAPVTTLVSSSCQGDVRDLGVLTEALHDVETVIHLASNPDIALAATTPAVDFDQGTLLTHHVCEAARIAGTRQILLHVG